MTRLNTLQFCSCCLLIFSNCYHQNESGKEKKSVGQMPNTKRIKQREGEGWFHCQCDRNGRFEDNFIKINEGTVRKRRCKMAVI